MLFLHSRFWLCFSASLVISLTSYTQTNKPDSTRLAWFQDAKLGIFIHWGIYAVNGVDESWSFYNHYTPYETYMQQLKGFSASHYNPEGWADLIQSTGARYAVITTKHHDGVALWDTRFGNLNVVHQTPAGKDLVGPFVKAIRSKGLKAGLYFSLIDWSYPDYPGFTKGEDRYQIKDDSARWKRFLNYYEGQLEELSTRYQPDLIWFDGDWEHTASEWETPEMRAKLLQQNPGVIFNSRFAGQGDYATPEQGVPVLKPTAPYWELCLTSNDSWGYQGTDKQYKTPFDVIRIFADVLSQGGNLLLDFGPDARGDFREQDINLMKIFGSWVNKHQEAIFGTRSGLPPGHYYGPSTLSKDHKTLYLFLTGAPANNQLILKGISSKIAMIRVIGSGQKLYHFVEKGRPWWSSIPGVLYIDVPEETQLDPYMTVLAVQFNEPLKIFREDGSGY